MSYIPTNWQNGDVITAEKMNKIEEGISSVSNDDGINGGEFDLPATPSTDGTYTLQNTVANGSGTLAWGSDPYPGWDAVIKVAVDEDSGDMTFTLLKGDFASAYAKMEAGMPLCILANFYAFGIDNDEVIFLNNDSYICSTKLEAGDNGIRIFCISLEGNGGSTLVKGYMNLLWTADGISLVF